MQLPLSGALRLPAFFSDASLLLTSAELHASDLPLARRHPRTEVEALRVAIQTFFLIRYASLLYYSNTLAILLLYYLLGALADPFADRCGGSPHLDPDFVS